MSLRGWSFHRMRAGQPVSSRGRIIRMCVYFAVAYTLLLSAAAALETTRAGRALMDGTATATAWGLRLLGADAHVEKTLVISSVSNVEIIYECTAIFPAALFVAAVLAFPVPLAAKARGLALGMPAIFLLNEARLVSLLYVQAHIPSGFEAIHLIVWPAVLVIAITGGWLAWAMRELRSREAAGAGARPT